MAERDAHRQGEIDDAASSGLNIDRAEAARTSAPYRSRRRSAMTAEERKTQRDWGLYVMLFYGFLAVTLGSFAVFAVTNDPGRPHVIANRAATPMIQFENPASPSALSFHMPEK